MSLEFRLLFQVKDVLPDNISIEIGQIASMFKCREVLQESHQHLSIPDNRLWAFPIGAVRQLVTSNKLPYLGNISALHDLYRTCSNSEASLSFR